MPALISSAILAFVLALALTPIWRTLLRRLRQPERRAARARHPRSAESVPRLGGLAVLTAAALALAVGRWLGWDVVGQNSNPLLRQLSAGVLVVVAVGAADDLFDLLPPWKFAGQIAAALLVIAEGIRVRNVFYRPLPEWVSVLLTVVWLVGCTNAFNLIDGLDGLATGLALFATGTVLAHAVLIGQPALALLMGVTFGALCGFLIFNFPPASIYLGDTGSLGIGFLLGCLALAWASKATTVVGLVAPLFALLVPMLDTGVAIARRGLTGRPLFAGDRRHLHHRLLGRGLSPRRAVLVLYAVAGAGALAALVLADLRQRHTFELVIVLFVVLAALGAQQLGYVEITSMGRLLAGRADPRRLLLSEMTLRQCTEEIAGAADCEAIWRSLRGVAEVLEFSGVELCLGTAPNIWWQRREILASGSAPNAESAAFSGWMCQVALGEQGHHGVVRFWRGLESEPSGFLEAMAQALGGALTPRVEALRIHGRAAAAGSGR